MSYVKRLRLYHFRNFDVLDIRFEKGVQHIVGRNGLGKTNILEALYMLSTGRSFRTSNLKETIQYEQPFFQIEAEFERDGVDQTLSLTFDGAQRRMKHNETISGGFTNLLGLLPSVVFSPSDIQLISGSPKDRRRFLNLHIAQSDPLYVYYLTRYTKALAQRNALLRKKSHTSMDVWEEELSKSGKYLTEKRRDLIKRLSAKMKERYKMLSNQEEKPSIHFDPSITKEIRAECWKSEREKEFLAGHTLVGPHRDDFQIKLNDKSARLYASEGQKRTLIAAIKLAECDDLDNPIVSIDDFGVHLDEGRQVLLKTQFSTQTQLFLTSPEPTPFSWGSRTIELEEMLKATH